MTRYIALDTETTGIGTKVHRLTEIAAVEFNPETGELTGSHYHTFLNPERAIAPEVTAVHGKTWEDLKDSPLFPDVVDDFLNYISGAQLVIHNAPFDVGFLNAALKKAKRPLLADTAKGVTDTLAWSRRHVRMRKHTLDRLLDRYEIDRTARVLHGALIDCEMLAKVYPHLKREVDVSLSRVNSILPFELDATAPELVEDLVERVFLLDELAKLLDKESERYRAVIKEKVEGLNREGDFFLVRFANRTQTDWDRILKDKLPADFNLAPYQKSGSAMYIDYV